MTTPGTHGSEAPRSHGQTNEGYKRLIENAQDLIYRYRVLPTPAFEYVSPSATQITGYTPEEHYADPQLGRKVVHPDDWPALEDWLTSTEGSSRPLVLRWRRKDGLWIWTEQHNKKLLDDQGHLVAIEGIARDITERKLLETQIQNAQRMEIAGRLAAGLGHDFNNLLTTILGHADLVQKQLPDGHPAQSNLAEIRKAGESGALLIQQLLNFSRQEVIQPKVHNLNDVVQDTYAILQKSLGEHIHLITRTGSSPRFIHADPGQMKQLILNLALHAQDTMPNGGTLTIESSTTLVTDEQARRSTGARPGPHVVLIVSHTGRAVGNETRVRIFEPFFRTSKPGLGAGLALASVHNIVQQAGGFIEVDSGLSGGTVFRVYFPRPAQGSSPETPSSGGVGAVERITILLTEDEAGVRMLAREVLKRQGYTVLEAQNGFEALKIENEYAGTIHLLLTDVVMPGLGGRELAERLVAKRPGTKVIFMSGYTDDSIVRHGVRQSAVAFLPKPFMPDDLVKKVREELAIAP